MIYALLLVGLCAIAIAILIVCQLREVLLGLQKFWGIAQELNQDLEKIHDTLNDIDTKLYGISVDVSSLDANNNSTS